MSNLAKWTYNLLRGRIAFYLMAKKLRNLESPFQCKTDWRAYLNNSRKNPFDVGPDIPTFLGHVTQAAVIRERL